MKQLIPVILLGAVNAHAGGGHEHGHHHDQHGDHSETHTELSPDAVAGAQIGIETAGPESIANTITVYGRILTNGDKVAHLAPRFSGVLRDVRKSLGDTVAKGEVVAIVESNQSLQNYEIQSHISGSVVERHGTLGEFVTERQDILVVADLSEVWADFQLHGNDSALIKRGQEITIDLGRGRVASARVSYISPVADEATQSRLIRAVLSNSEGLLHPGLFTSAEITTSETKVPIAVRREAVQRSGDRDVVYVTDGTKFEETAVEVGRKDSQFVEIKSGLPTGARYVARNSFIIKADIGKHSAAHEH